MLLSIQPAAGVDPGSETDLSISGISPDGTMLYGQGLEDGMQPSTWVAIVPEPTSFLLAATGGTLLIPFRRLRQRSLI